MANANAGASGAAGSNAQAASGAASAGAVAANSNLEPFDPHAVPGGDQRSAESRAGSATAPASAGSSLSDVRGPNWAFGGDKPQASALVRRSIRVAVYPDRLVVLPSRQDSDAGVGEAKQVSLYQPVEQVADDLVAALREHVASWGLAGRGMTWRPVLATTVSPGAEQNAAKLARLLEGSGIDVEAPSVADRRSEGDRDAPR
jgi:hypothetical protein